MQVNEIKSKFFAFGNPFLSAFVVGLLNMCSGGHAHDRRGVSTARDDSRGAGGFGCVVSRRC